MVKKNAKDKKFFTSTLVNKGISKLQRISDDFSNVINAKIFNVQVLLSILLFPSVFLKLV